MDYEKEIPFGAFDSELMHQEISIPEGFEATIDGNKIILKKIESEDEKILKEIISIVKSYRESCITEGNHRFDNCISWLEKQGNQNHIEQNLEMVEALRTEYEKGRADAFAQMQQEWSEEDECYMAECINAIATKDGWSFEEKRKTKHWLKSIKDRIQPQLKQEWSEEDSRNLSIAIEYVFQHGYLSTADWLRKLKERYTWKPSDEQITVLELASKYERVFTPKQIDILIGLKEQLKKLKGE